MRPIVGRRRCCEFESLAAIELPDDYEVREAFDVGEPGFKLRQDFEHAIGIVLRAESFGNVAGVFVGTADESDWARGEHSSTLNRSQGLKPREPWVYGVARLKSCPPVCALPFVLLQR